MCMKSICFSFILIIYDLYIQDECNDWVYASKVILAELTGDESIIDTGPPKREVDKTLIKDQLDWHDSSLERRKVNFKDYFNY